MTGMAHPRWRPADRRDLLRVQRLHARCGAPGRPVRGRTSSTRGPTTPSVWARTGRPTSRSSSWRPCGPCPGLRVVRPADANEAAQAWQEAVDGDGPPPWCSPARTCRCWPRRPSGPQGVCPGRLRAGRRAERRRPEVVLIGTGSEVHLCVEAAAALAAPRDRHPGGVAALLGAGSRPKDATYRRSVFPPGVPALAVEAAASFGWDRYADDTVVHRPRSGRRPPGTWCSSEFGFTADNVVERALAPARRGRTASRHRPPPGAPNTGGAP